MLLDVRADHLKIVQEILRKFVPEREVWAFGSRAKWLAKEYSDLDLCIVGDSALSFRTLGLMQEAFEDSDLPYKVDLVDWATTSESFRKMIERDRVLVQKVELSGAVPSKSEWNEKPLGDVVELKRGYDLPKDKRSPGKVPIISSSGITDYHAESMAQGPGVVTGRYGTIGEVFFVEGDYWPLNTTLYVRDFKGNDALFVSYLLRTLDFHAYSDKGAVPGVNRNHLHMARVRVPDRVTQEAIAKVLNSLDRKISLNRRINQTLEAMAQAIFKSWFVDFDPVKAKIAAIKEGRDPLRAAMSAISGKLDAELDTLPREQFDQIAATASLFPDEMEESELGEIPRGWSVHRVGNVLELVYGKALKSTDRKEGTVPVYGSGGVTGFHNTPLVPHGSIIVGRKGTVGSLYWEDDPFFPIDTTYYVRPLAAPLTFCYYTMQTLGLEKMNTDAAVPGLNRENVYRLELVFPDSATLQQFDLEVTTLRKAIRAHSGASKSLADLRDTLLPKLISGELSVEKILPESEDTA
jgi:type I restriction enzyme, S subunit